MLDYVVSVEHKYKFYCFFAVLLAKVTWSIGWAVTFGTRRRSLGVPRLTFGTGKVTVHEWRTGWFIPNVFTATYMYCLLLAYVWPSKLKQNKTIVVVVAGREREGAHWRSHRPLWRQFSRPQNYTVAVTYSGVARIWCEGAQNYMKIVCLLYNDTK